MKACTECKLELPLEKFIKYSSGNRGKICSSCLYLRDCKKGNCIDCGAKIRQRAKRCKPCNGKFHSGENGYNYVGPSRLNSNGYVLRVDKPNHPNANKVGHILEHTLVMSEHLGRPLTKGENVHHKNGDRADNRLENLELWSTSQPSGQRVADKLAWAKELLALYEPEALK